MNHDLTSQSPSGRPDPSAPASSGGAADGTAAPAVRLCSPGSVVASIPLLFGFHPENSLIVLGLTPSAGLERIQYGVRLSLDQVRGREREVATDLMVRLHDHGAEEALLLVFAPRGATGTRARPDHYRRLTSALKSQLAAGPVEDHVVVVDAIFTAGGQWWSYMCRNKRCCPPEGTTVPSAPPLALAAAFAGSGPVFESREAMDATFAPYGVTAARRMKTAVKKAAEDSESWVLSGRSRALVTTASGRAKTSGRQSAVAAITANAAAAASRDGRRVPRSRTAEAQASGEPPIWNDEAVRAAQRLADRLLARCADGPVDLSDVDAAELLIALEEWRVRDYLACHAFEESRAELLLSLMTELARRAPEPAWRTTPLALAAWAAWALGRTSLAQCAVDRALTCDENYHFALLIRAGIHHGIPAAAVRSSADNTRRAMFEEEIPASDSQVGETSSAASLPTQRNRFESEEARP